MIMDSDDHSSQGLRDKKYYIDTVNVKVPRKGMEVTSFLRDGMSKSHLPNCFYFSLFSDHLLLMA